MNKKILIILASLASLLCITGGVLFILGITNIIYDDYAIWGIGLFMISQGFFIGPMLLKNT